MTEQELLEQAYMGEEQLSFFHQRLRQMHDRIAQQLQNTALTHEASNAPDEADRASAEEEHWLSLSIKEREVKMLQEIKQALKRLKEGDYGYCEDTGEPIGVPRLLANPVARYSLEAMTRRERQEKLYSGHRAA